MKCKITPVKISHTYWYLNFPAPHFSLCNENYSADWAEQYITLSSIKKLFVYYAYTSDSWKYRVVYIFNNSISYIFLTGSVSVICLPSNFISFTTLANLSNANTFKNNYILPSPFKVQIIPFDTKLMATLVLLERIKVRWREN